MLNVGPGDQEQATAAHAAILAAALTTAQRRIKRAFDLVVAALLLGPALVIMGIAWCLIRLDSPGAAIFKQQRVGEGGRLFTIYKFRTMIDGAAELQPQVNHVDEQGRVIHKLADDPRITRVGLWLRRTSVDELPQLFNVLAGSMSLVGPRPELPWIVAHYEPWQYQRLSVPQGITGWWQVQGRAAQPMYQHTAYDLYYITHYSLWLDFTILLRTVWIVLKGFGAY